MSFLISALPKAEFEHLFKLDRTRLAALQAMRVIADKKPGFPCRVSLRDAEPGEELVLLHYEHQAAASPFQAGHGIYVLEAAEEARLESGAVPEMFRTRILSLRGFDEADMMNYAELVDGKNLEPVLNDLLSKPKCNYVHIHFAAPGCYAARADRA